MNKKTVLLVILALVLLIAVVLIIRSCGTAAPEQNPAQAETEDKEAQAPAGNQAESPADSSAKPADAEEEKEHDVQESTAATLIENGGDIEIIIPDDEESDGF